MESALFYIVLFSILSGLGSVSLVGLVLLIPTDFRKVLLPCLVSYAVGTLLGAAFIGMLPRATELIGPKPAAYNLLAGFIAFFILEKLLLWRHCHVPECKTHKASANLILIGDGLHNFIDGLVIASAFLISVPLGIATSIAIIGHELPQELGDFAVLLDGGFSKKKALFYNLLSSSTTLVAGVLGYYFFDSIRWLQPYILSYAAASFIYIAVADLVPGLHGKAGIKTLIRQTALIILGIFTIIFISNHVH